MRNSSPLLMLRKNIGTFRLKKQVPKYLMTVGTPFGSFRLIQLPFELVVSQNIFQKQLDSALYGLSGVTGILDDTFVFGSTEEKHNKNLARFMEGTRPEGIVRVNKVKLQFKRSGLFLWKYLDSPRCTIRQQQSGSHTKHATPEDVKSLQSFLGLISYLT